MKVFGADFSGARNPSKGIYYAEGSLNGQTLHLEQIVHCDDRLDLLAAIHFSKAPWGLDFPFSIADEALTSLQVNNWSELLLLVQKYDRKGFDNFIAGNGVPSCENQCNDRSICCRYTDASVYSFSPLKRTNPNMRMMTYAGLKLLTYLRRLGNVVYPFDNHDKEASRLYEVYPSHTWRQVGDKRSSDLVLFTKKFRDKYGFEVALEDGLLKVGSLDAADAVVACVTLAHVLKQYNLEDDWSKQHNWASNDEWEHRHREGLIVRVY